MKYLVIALLFLAVLAPVAAQEVASIPVADGETQARTCYVNSMNEWNHVMATAPLDVKQLTNTYKLFSFCANVALNTGPVMPNGNRLPWTIDYFADTMGALYSQIQLTAATKGTERCTHVSLANDLAEQILETTGGLDDPTLSQFNDDWTDLTKKLKSEALTCGVKFPLSV